MKHAFISDVHSNIEALEAVLGDIEKQSVEEVVCLGDIVGYGPNPNECTEIIRKRSKITLLGNHDAAAVKLIDTQLSYSHAKPRSIGPRVACSRRIRHFSPHCP